MNERTRKIFPMLFMIALLSSTMLVMLGHAQTSTTASLYIAPNPIGLGQTASGIALIQPDPPIPNYFTGLTLTVNKPDEATETLGPFNTDAHGICHFTYTPDVLGTFGFVLHFPGETFGEFNTYLPSDSAEFFLEVQYDPVPLETPVVPGDYVTIYPDPTDPKVTLYFEHITSTGMAAVSKTATPPSGVPPLTGIIGFYYDFEVTFSFTGPVEVGLPYDEGLGNEEDLSMWHYEGGAVGDVNGDGNVDWKDLLRITKALGSAPRMRRWDSACDLNGDRRVNFSDLFIALSHYGESTSAWIDVTTYVDTVNNIVYGSTTNFPPFGIRFR